MTATVAAQKHTNIFCDFSPQMLLGFLKRVVDCNENLMNLNNVAMIMAPNLFLVASGTRLNYTS